MVLLGDVIQGTLGLGELFDGVGQLRDVLFEGLERLVFFFCVGKLLGDAFEGEEGGELGFYLVDGGFYLGGVSFVVCGL